VPDDCDRPAGQGGTAAAWPLSKHAQAHPRVKDLLEKELAGARSEPQRAQLRGILDGKISLK
jgi:hypothetical protein